MLSAEYRLRKKKDIDAVFKRGKFFRKLFLGIKIKKNKKSTIRVAFIVGKKVSKKAVTRNLIKRRLREITRKISPRLEGGYDIIVIAMPGIEKRNFMEIEKVLVQLYKKAHLIK